MRRTPVQTRVGQHNNLELLRKFLNSRREGISPRTIEFYESRLKPFVENYDLTPESINKFLASLTCGNGKHSYFRAIRAFCNWLLKQGYLRDNPIQKVDAPKPAKKILPSLTTDEVYSLIGQADNLRDRAIISLFVDSGVRLSELANIRATDIDWENMTVIIWGKGNEQRKAPFTQRTANLLKEWIDANGTGVNNIWHISTWGVVSMLRRLRLKTGLPCNPHTFRRTFACILHRAGMDVEHIMRLGGWETLDMVLRYTKSVKFEDSLNHYKAIFRQCDQWDHLNI